MWLLPSFIVFGHAESAYRCAFSVWPMRHLLGLALLACLACNRGALSVQEIAYSCRNDVPPKEPNRGTSTETLDLADCRWGGGRAHDHLHNGRSEFLPSRLVSTMLCPVNPLLTLQKDDLKLAGTLNPKP